MGCRLVGETSEKNNPLGKKAAVFTKHGGTHESYHKAFGERNAKTGPRQVMDSKGHPEGLFCQKFIS